MTLSKVELGRKIGAKILGRKYGYGFAWTWDTVLDASGTEDFNDPVILRQGEDFVDAGGAWGFWTVRASKYYQHVVSFEPDKRLYEQLLKNIRLNRLENVIPVFAALGAENGRQSFYYYGKGESSLLPEHMGRKPTGPSYDVDICTIDSFVKAYDLKPSVLKLDVEAAEKEVLEGASETIAKFRPTILVEVHYPVLKEEVEDAWPGYLWVTRWRYLNTSVYPFEKQPHLLGMPL